MIFVDCELVIRSSKLRFTNKVEEKEKKRVRAIAERERERDREGGREGERERERLRERQREGDGEGERERAKDRWSVFAPSLALLPLPPPTFPPSSRHPHPLRGTSPLRMAGPTFPLPLPPLFSRERERRGSSFFFRPRSER